MIYSFSPTQMTSRQVEVSDYNIISFDGQSDHMLWKKQEKKVKDHGLCFVSEKSFIHISDIKYRDSQVKIVYMMMEHLYTLIMKQIKRYAEVTEFCDSLQQTFH